MRYWVVNWWLIVAENRPQALANWRAKSGEWDVPGDLVEIVEISEKQYERIMQRL